MRQVITQEMKEHFEKRTKKHIKLVNKYYKKVKLFFPIILKDYPLNWLFSHDQSKFEEPEYSPYVLVNWKYYTQDNNLPFSPSEDQKNRMNEATLHHITTNRHHPEYWDSNFDSSKFNMKNRDETPNKKVNAFKMPEEFIIEMVCDWMAMSEEKETDPFKWAKKNINVRWLFTNIQEVLIYKILHKIWRN